MITEPLFYLIAVPAILISGISKGGFGGGVGILTVPAMALVVSPLQAAGIMLPLLCLMDLVGLRAYRRTWDRPSMAVLAPAALSGIALGALSAGLLAESHIRLLIGVIAVSFTVDYWLGRRGHEAPKARNRLKGGLLGVVSGFTSFLAHAGGPPISIYLLPLRLDKTVFVGTTVVFFAVVNYAKLAPYAWLGQLGSVNLTTSLALSPLAPVGMWLGLWLHTRVAPELFYKLCYAFVFVVGCKLLYDGLAPWISAA